MSLEYGWAPSHQRVYADKPVARGSRISTIGGMSINGIETAMCFEGTLNTVVFLYFIEHFLVPVLTSKHVVVMDNASVHKNTDVLEMIENTGASLIYLPPYSPEFNPIEMAWSKLKQYLRKTKARTKDALYDAIARGLKLITSDNAMAWVQHAGYIRNQM